MGSCCTSTKSDEHTYSTAKPLIYCKTITKNNKEQTIQKISDPLDGLGLLEYINLRINSQEQDISEIDKFIVELLNEINMVRLNPNSYSKKIESHLKYIFLKPNHHSKEISFYYDHFNYPKINLKTGEPAFKNCIKLLNETNPMPPLKINEEIVIKAPDKVSDMTDLNKIMDIIKIKKNEFSIINKYNLFGFHYDNGSIHSEISTILQLVDDNDANGQRRNNILNRNFKYLGVSVGKIKPNRFIVYLSFAGN